MGGGTGMWYYKAAYIAAIILTEIASIAAAVAHPEYDLGFLSFGTLVLAVLTFPLGAVALVIGSLLIFSGQVTPTESAFLVTPVYAVLGYWQWWSLFPTVYRRGQ